MMTQDESAVRARQSPRRLQNLRQMTRRGPSLFRFYLDFRAFTISCHDSMSSQWPPLSGPTRRRSFSVFNLWITFLIPPEENPAKICISEIVAAGLFLMNSRMLLSPFLPPFLPHLAVSGRITVTRTPPQWNHDWGRRTGLG